MHYRLVCCKLGILSPAHLISLFFNARTKEMRVCVIICLRHTMGHVAHAYLGLHPDVQGSLFTPTSYKA